MNFLLDRFGPERFLALYTTCSPSTFESDCRRILGLDLDGLDAAFRADIERRRRQAGLIERRWLERLRLGPAVKADDWKAFLDEYFAAAERLLAPYRHSRLTAVWTRSDTDAGDQSHDDTNEVRVLRSGEFASLRRRSPGHELAFLAHPRRSIRADRDPPDRPWQAEDTSIRTPDQSRHRALRRIDEFDYAGRRSVALVALADDIADLARSVSFDHLVVTALERFTEAGRPRVRLRIENHSPADWRLDWRAMTYVLAADDLYAAQSERSEGVEARQHYVSIRASRTIDTRGSRAALHADCRQSRPRGAEDERAEGRRPPIRPDPRGGVRPRPLPRRPAGDGDPSPAPPPDDPCDARHWFWLPFPIGGLCLIGGAAISLGMRRDRVRPAPIL